MYIQYVCMYVCMYIQYVCICDYVDINYMYCMYVLKTFSVRMYACMYVCMYVCMYMSQRKQDNSYYVPFCSKHVRMYVCMCV